MPRIACIVTLACIAAGTGIAFAADGAGNPKIPVFAFTPNTGWVIDRSFGVE